MIFAIGAHAQEQSRYVNIMNWFANNKTRTAGLSSILAGFGIEAALLKYENNKCALEQKQATGKRRK